MKDFRNKIKPEDAYTDDLTVENMAETWVMAFIIALIGIFHAYLLLLFSVTGATVMAVLNVISVAVYALCVYLVLAKKSTKVFQLIYIELIVHASAAMFMVGTEYGFGLYYLIIVPMAYYASYIANYQMGAEKRIKLNPLASTLIALGVLTITEIVCYMSEPVYNIGSDNQKSIIFMVNVVLIMATMIVFIRNFFTHIITMQKMLAYQNSKLEYLSLTDQLTNLKNRRAVEKYKDGKFGENTIFSVILSDVDDFKSINDTYGHDCGDEALKYIATAFMNNIRKNDTVIRWGGEEILVLLPEATVGEAKNIVEKIRNMLLSEPFLWKDNKVYLTLTFGVVEKSSESSIEELIDKADRYLYAGKNDGKNIVVDKAAYINIKNNDI